MIGSAFADVLHTVGPIDCSEAKLRSCYERCLQLTLENEIRSVVSHYSLCVRGHAHLIMMYLFVHHMQAFSCIATGVYGKSVVMLHNT